MTVLSRVKLALPAAGIHLLLTLAVAAVAAILVFGLWFPYPYQELSGGRELFLLIVTVDIVCGPILTVVLYNRTKSAAELWRDLGLVVIVQLGALGYGLFTVSQARPLFMVQEVERFKVVTAQNVDAEAIAKLQPLLKPRFFSGPLVVAIRPPINENERVKVFVEALQGGRDYAERPEFYLPYDNAGALKALNRARPLIIFFEKQPSQSVAGQKLAAEKNADLSQWMYLPIVARQDWVAVLDKQGRIQGFLKGDGF